MYPIAIKKIDGIENELIQEKDPYEKGTILDMGVDGVLFDVYGDLIDIVEKYIGKDKIKKDLATDFSGTLSEALYPYLIEYKVDFTKIDNLGEYASKKQEMLEKKYNEPVWQMKLKLL